MSRKISICIPILDSMVSNIIDAAYHHLPWFDMSGYDPSVVSTDDEIDTAIDKAFKSVVAGEKFKIDPYVPTGTHVPRSYKREIGLLDIQEGLQRAIIAGHITPVCNIMVDQLSYHDVRIIMQFIIWGAIVFDDDEQSPQRD